MVAARDGGGVWLLLFYGYRVSVWEDEKVLKVIVVNVLNATKLYT